MNTPPASGKSTGGSKDLTGIEISKLLNLRELNSITLDPYPTYSFSHVNVLI
mgnify:CR=1 FL=1